MINFRVPAALVAALLTVPAAPAQAAAAHHGDAEMFATNNTAIITDPDDPRLRTRLRKFDREVRALIRDGGAHTTASTLLNGVFWSTDLQKTTYERSRRFALTRTDTRELHAIADRVRKEYHQESVLTFERHPRTSPQADAVRIEVPGIDPRDLHDGLAADPTARAELGGGSVTLDRRLILIAELDDHALARAFITRLGGDLTQSRTHYGDREFVG